ncbi:hypothetical protein [Clostridium cochlearium]|uniref:hypothetical protein n=1 Tax=Clostridium cochlearium TaxID=1494 RepID=UPI00241DC440|nr:hypothetical protein [Clostridium cochlearium]MBE6064822.1 hypothetical protein [Clostridium cochlearium]
MKLLIKRIKLIDNRSKDEVIRLELFATLIPYIFSKEVFKNNKDIKSFIDLLELQNEIKDYVYKSRTQIVARICKEIQNSERKALLHNAKVLKSSALELENNGKDEKSRKNIVDVLNKYSRNK